MKVERGSWEEGKRPLEKGERKKLEGRTFGGTRKRGMERLGKAGRVDETKVK